jgi:hypothetical protein
MDQQRLSTCTSREQQLLRRVKRALFLKLKCITGVTDERPRLHKYYKAALPLLLV